MKSLLTYCFILLFGIPALFSQHNTWQQKADYNIAIDYNIQNDNYLGTESIQYINRSADTLNKVYFHLYFNAFQPGSDMDVFVQNIPDPQRGLDWKLKYLTSSEIGKMQVEQVLQDSKITRINHLGTILEVDLAEPILPGSTCKLEVSFTAQTPVISRRAGRKNEEGIELTMSQWYPKLCVYNSNGWQLTPYIGREFHSDFGDYDVQIRIDSSFIVAAGSDSVSVKKDEKSNKNTWHFKSDNVIDFAWAADPDYQHYSVTTEDDITLHFYYQEAQNTENRWEKMSTPLKAIFPYINQRFGQYPYKSFHFIQAGDGGMEYPKSTFITGERSLGSLIGVSVHEIMHSWYQGVIATQENLYSWMDEGFASFASTEIKNYMRKENIYFKAIEENPYKIQYDNYTYLANSGYEEAMHTPSNFFFSNFAYNVASYQKGEIFLKQLEYVIGKDKLDLALLKYFEEWQFKHPTPEDFIHVAEKVSEIKLDWYLYFWTKTTHKIDYELTVKETNPDKTVIRILKKGKMPMPIDLLIEYKDGSDAVFIIPLDLMYGQKSTIYDSNEITLQAWPWTHSEYEIALNISINDIKSVRIDPSERLADISKLNNRWTHKD
jgi:hypothetical protein